MRHLRRLKSVAMTAVLMMLSASVMPLLSQSAMAQATTGSIRGTVFDQSNAVVPDAIVKAKNQNTGVESAAFKSSGDGVYNIPNLQPGTYTLTVESPNFKRGVYTDIEVRLGQDATIDVTLQPGGATESVTVTASAETVIQKETAQVSSNFESRQVQDLPSNVAGGGIDTLALLVPGVTPGFGGNSNGTTLSVNGNRSRSNNFNIDGQDNNDLSVGGPAFFVGNQDVVQDFQIITNNFSAQYGRNQGAIVNILTKGGTNDLHGTAFWFHRDRKLFETLTNIERASGREEAAPLLYNVYGGTLGGPIIKDRAFFFGSFQGTRTRETSIVRGGGLAILPEEFARLRATYPNNAAIEAYTQFSAFAITDLGSVRPRTDIGAGAFDTIVLPRDPALPCNPADPNDPNCIRFRAAQPEREFQGPIAGPHSFEEFTGRGDFKITDKDSLWARYLFQDGNNLNSIPTFNGIGANGFTGDIPFRSQNIAGAWTRQLSSRALNEFRTSYQRLFVNFGGGCEGLKGCIPGPNDIGTSIAQLTFANILGENTGTPLLQIGGGAGFPQGRTVQVYQFVDNLSMLRGRHQFLMGADIRRLKTNSIFLPNLNGTFAFSTPTRLAANSPQQVTLAVGPAEVNYNETDQFYYFQDDWKVRDNLTLNLGVRYEYTGQPINALHELTLERESNPDTAVFRQSLPIESRIVPKIPTDKNNWAPRVGFAYSPRFGKKWFGEDATVIRGGYSIAYDPAFGNILTNVQGGAPTTFANIVRNPAVPTGANPRLFPLPSATPTGEAVRSFAEAQGLITRNTFDPRFLNQTIVSPDFHAPYSQQWSLGIQRQINSDNVFEVRYLGTHGVGLFQTVNANPKIDNLLNGFTTAGFGGETFTFPGFPNLVPSGVRPLACVNNPATPDDEGVCNGRLSQRGLVISRDNSGQSLYHSLQTRYNGRLFNQMNWGAAYTLSKALDNASEIFFFQDNSIAQHPFNITDAERSYSGFDRRHVFALNGIWDLPYYKDQKGVLGHLLGGWQLNGTYNLASGLRYTPVQLFNAVLNNINATYKDTLLGDNLRPFYGNPDAPRTQVGISQIDASLIFGVPVENPNGFYSFNELNNGNVVAIGQNDVRYIFNGPGAARIFGTPFGNVPRNIERGPKLNQLNAGLFKNTQITEGIRLQFRTEVFNLLNHPNPGIGAAFAAGGLAIPSQVLEAAGTPGGAFGEFRDIEYGRRVVQFGLKVIF